MGKGAAVLDDLAQRAMQCFHAVGGVDGSADFRWIVEKRRDALPVAPPDLAHRWIAVPGLLQTSELILGLGYGRGTIDQLQIGSYLFALLPGHVVQRSSYQMHDAELYLGARIHGFDGLRKAFESIHAGDEDVFDPAV